MSFPDLHEHIQQTFSAFSGYAEYEQQLSVLLDCDGILSDFVGGYLKLLQEHTGLVRSPADVVAFDIGTSLGLTPEQSKRMGRAVSDTPHFARGLAVYPGAIEGVAELHRVADVYIVTSPWNSNKTWCYDREQWLAEHFGIPHARVIHTSAKHLVRGDVLVDDRVKTVRQWAEEHRAGSGIVWDTPHNGGEPWGWMRTNNWKRLVETVAGCV